MSRSISTRAATLSGAQDSQRTKDQWSTAAAVVIFWPAAFFVGMDAVRRGDKQRAREQLQLAQARCPTVSQYNWAASSELKRL